MLLGILVFNWCGYRLLTACLEAGANEQLKISLDDNKYDESELISIKVPAERLSYYNNSSQFERVDGEIEIGGLQYNYVKRRLYNDSIEMLCVPNHSAMHLRKADNDFFKLVNNLQRPAQDKKTDSHSYKSFSGDYFTANDLFNITDPFCNMKKSSFYYSVMLPFGSKFTEERPPQKMA